MKANVLVIAVAFLALGVALLASTGAVSLIFGARGIASISPDTMNRGVASFWFWIGTFILMLPVSFFGIIHGILIPILFIVRNGLRGSWRFILDFLKQGDAGSNWDSYSEVLSSIFDKK